MAWFTAPHVFTDGSVLTAGQINSTVVTIRDGTVTALHGGTGLDTSASSGIMRVAAGTWSALAPTSGGVLYGSSATAAAFSAALAANGVVYGGGAGTAPAATAAGAATVVLHGGTPPTFGAVVLTTDVSGVLPVANGGLAVALSDPNADRLLFWDDSAGVYAYLTAGTGLTITDTTLTASGRFMLTGGHADETLGAGLTRFTGVSGPHPLQGTESSANNNPAPFAFTATNLRVWLNTAPTAGQSVTITFRVNGADTALSVAIADANTTGVDTDSVSVAAGDTLTIKEVASAGAAAVRVTYALQGTPA